MWYAKKKSIYYVIHFSRQVKGLIFRSRQTRHQYPILTNYNSILTIVSKMKESFRQTYGNWL